MRFREYFIIIMKCFLSIVDEIKDILLFLVQQGVCNKYKLNWPSFHQEFSGIGMHKDKVSAI